MTSMLRPVPLQPLRPVEKPKPGPGRALLVVAWVTLLVLTALFVVGLGCGLFFAGCQVGLRLIPK